MNQDQSLSTKNNALSRTAGADSRSARVLRRLLVEVLSRADQGYFLLRENGQVIAEVGSKDDELHAEAEILDSRVYARALLGGNVAAGEAFVDGWWTSPDITQVPRFFARNMTMMAHWGRRFGWMFKPLSWWRQVTRSNSKRQAKKNILAHYDLGNDLYESFLDPRMQYSSAIYHAPDETLAKAQTNKLTRICEQLQLSEDDHLLEIGSGWGGLAMFAAMNFGCRVTTATISDKQQEHAQQRIDDAGLSDRITLLNRDYRLLEGQFDKLVSVEMIEAVGERYLPGFFRKVDSLLKPNGLFMLQAITMADQRFDAYRRSEDFIQKHVFPGGFLPSMTEMTRIMSDKTELIVRDVLDIGLDYAQTLAHWKERFLDVQPQLATRGYDQLFRNLWLYYLGYCEGGFREKRISAVQLLASKDPHRY